MDNSKGLDKNRKFLEHGTKIASTLENGTKFNLLWNILVVVNGIKKGKLNFYIKRIFGYGGLSKIKIKIKTKNK